MKLCKHFIVLFLSLLFYFSSSAQIKSHYYNNAWFRVYLNDKITDKLKWELMLQQRRQEVNNNYNLLDKQQLQSYWLWLHYALPQNMKLSISPLCYFETKRLFNLDDRAVHEWRWCARLETQEIYKYFQIFNRYGLEYRYRDILKENNFDGNFRVRYMCRVLVPITKINNKPFNFIVSDEMLLQFGGAFNNSPGIFDQNRLFTGFNYEFYKNMKLELGYCYIVNERPSGTDIDIQNSVFVFLTFDNIFSQFKK